MAHDGDIAISGGGITGTALALTLAKAGLSVLLLDKSPVEKRKSTGFDGRAYALSLSSCRVLESLGLSPLLRDSGQEIRAVRVTDGRAGQGACPAVLGFDSCELPEGPMAIMIEDRYLRSALLDLVAAEPKITHLSPTSIADYRINASQVLATLESGETCSARMLAGCDGRNGPVAGNFETFRINKDYRQSAIVCAIEHDLPHEGAAHQFFMPTGPLAILPLPQNRSSIVWTETTANADRLARLSDDEFLRRLRPRFGAFLGGLRLASRRYVWPLSLSLAEKIAVPRVVLVGEAAHGLHPLAGQGLNLGLRDVAVLAETVIHAHRRGEDIGAIDVLRRYQDWRRVDAASLAAATDFFNWIYSNDNGLLRIGRRLGMQVVNEIPWLRRVLVRQAAGISGDLPRLVAGKAI